MIVKIRFWELIIKSNNTEYLAEIWKERKGY